MRSESEFMCVGRPGKMIFNETHFFLSASNKTAAAATVEP